MLYILCVCVFYIYVCVFYICIVCYICYIYFVCVFYIYIYIVCVCFREWKSCVCVRTRKGARKKERMRDRDIGDITYIPCSCILLVTPISQHVYPIPSSQDNLAYHQTELVCDYFSVDCARPSCQRLKRTKASEGSCDSLDLAIEDSNAAIVL